MWQLHTGWFRHHVWMLNKDQTTNGASVGRRFGGAVWLTIDPSDISTAMKVCAVVFLALAASCNVNAEPSPGPSPESIPDLEARKHSLKLLCPIAQKAGGGWGDDNINRGIASIEYGEEWPPNRAQFSAYKLCLIRGYSK